MTNTFSALQHNGKFIHEVCFLSWHGSWLTLLYSAEGTRVHNGVAFIAEGEGKIFLPLMCSCIPLGVWPPFTSWRQVKVHHNTPGCKELWKFRKLSGWKSDPSHVRVSAQRSAAMMSAIHGIADIIPMTSYMWGVAMDGCMFCYSQSWKGMWLCLLWS